MNCRRFQNGLFEYLEGGLPPRAQAAARAHLAGCGRCREIWRRHQELEQRLARGFRQATDSLRLDRGVEQRVLRAARETPPEPAADLSLIGLWISRRWPWALATGACVFAGLLALGRLSEHRDRDVRLLQGRHLAATATVQAFYPVPTYTFRKQGPLVLDMLTFETNAANGLVWLDNDRNHR